MTSGNPPLPPPPLASPPPPRGGGRRLAARDTALVASFAALIAVLGLPGALTPFGNAVPITLQTLGVMLAGAVLGWWRGALTVVIFLALVAAGLPLLAGGRGGVAVFAGPSAGYLIGWILGAAVIGLMVCARLPRYSPWWTASACIVGGIGVVYAIGIPVQAYILGTSGVVATAIGATAYLPGDALKVVVATVVAAAVHRAYPALPPALRSRS